MQTLLPIDAVLAPRRFVIEPPLTNGELEEFCSLNRMARIERTKEGVLCMNPPAGSFTGDGNARVTWALVAWWRTHRRGAVYDSSAGFYLPDGSMLSPDAAYLTREKLDRLTREDREGFPPACPDFIIELRSKSDSLVELREKMERWIENGAQLGWLLDPYSRQVFVYRTDRSPEILVADLIRGEGPVLGFALEVSEVWACFE